MEFRLLGPLEVLDGGEPLAIGGTKQRALLAVLLLHVGERASVDRLIEELWGNRPPATAAHTIQVYVSNLRKALGRERVLTRASGYLVQVVPGELDLARFEQALGEAREALAAGAPERAAALLREALALWRGAPLADFAYEPFAQAAIGRLEELRLTALEERIEADLASGRHGELVGELQELVGAHPLRERLRGQLMLSLYRSGRQAEALEAFQETRRLLVGELGIDPSPALQRLERAILQHDPELDLAAPAGERRPSTAERSILLAGEDAASLDRLLAFAEPLALSPPAHELILASPVRAGGDLAGATAAVNERRAILSLRGVAGRAVAFTSPEPGADLVRLASEQDVDLLLVDGPASLRSGGFEEAAAAVLAEAPCDVALLFGRESESGDFVLVPFGGAEHDWAALELGAWCARARGVELKLLGTPADEGTGERDASRLLAHAALAAQQLAGVVTEPTLAPPGERGVLEAADPAGLLVVGLPVDWRQRGLGATRTALAEEARPPAILVRRGLRPGGLAPRETLTLYTWSLSSIFEPAAARQSPSA